MPTPFDPVRAARRLAPRVLVASGLALAPAAPLAAADPRPAPEVAAPDPAVLAAVPAPSRGAVAAVVRAPTLSTQAAEGPFVAAPAVYDFLLDHPDRAALAWRRLDVPCAAITAAGGGQFRWADDKGSAVTWRAVARFTDGVVWLATGTVRAGALMPAVPVRAVAVLHAPRTAVAGDPAAATFEPTVTVYTQTDSRAATTLLRLAGPAAPRLAEQGAEQLLLFFSGPARYARQHPDQVPALFAP